MNTNQWFPCTEKLPAEYGNYLITTEYEEVDIGTFDPNGRNGWSGCDADGFYWMDKVIAWMPLPEPYVKGGSDE